jgi:hypothetical protein
VAVDKILETLDTLIDSYVEIYIGKYGRPKVSGAEAVIRLHNLSEAGATKLVNAASKYMMGPLVKGLNTGVDTDLINVRDEMVANLNQLLYLFTLR